MKKLSVGYIQANTYTSVQKLAVATFYAIVLRDALKLFIFNCALFNYLHTHLVIVTILITAPYSMFNFQLLQ